VDPSGRFAYAASTHFPSEKRNVFMYTINATTGALTSIGTIATGIDPASVAVDPSAGSPMWRMQKFSEESRNRQRLDVHHRRHHRALTSIGTIAAGSNPMSVAVDPSGKFAYVANLNSNDVSMYTIDVTTGP